MEQRVLRSRHNCLLTSYHNHLHPNSTRTQPLDAPVHQKKCEYFTSYYYLLFSFCFIYFRFFFYFLSPSCVSWRERRGRCRGEPGDSGAKGAESLGTFLLFFFIFFSSFLSMHSGAQSCAPRLRFFSQPPLCLLAWGLWCDTHRVSGSISLLSLSSGAQSHELRKPGTLHIFCRVSGMFYY